jgi:hypothetical protein
MDDLSEHLREHIGFLKRSSESFDTGFEDEAKRLAVSARVLLHDTRASRSLLGQLDLLTIPFHSTVPENDLGKGIDLAPHIPLLQILLGSKPSYRVPLDDLPPRGFRLIPFTEWWSEIIFDDRLGNTLTRKGLVLTLANKEGGAHVDPNLTPSYEALKSRATMWQVRTPEGTHPLPGNIELLAMRQIAHELLRTLAQYG